MHYMRPTPHALNPLKPADQTISKNDYRGIEVATFYTKGRLTTMKNYGKGIGGALLSLAFVFGVFTATSGIAQAQDRNDDRNYQRGQQDGDRDGDRNDRNRQTRRRRHRDDRQGNNQGDWRRNQDQNRNNGVYNNGRYGNNGQYGRNGSYGNNGGYNQVELDRGYRQGLNTGASDGQRRQTYDPQRSHYFKNASSQAFRQGFVQGYDQGYRQYSRNGNQRNRTSNAGWGSVLGGILGRP
jgi:hypothetical protein